LGELYDWIKDLFGGLANSFFGGRRNRDFEKAGRVKGGRGPRVNATAEFRRGERKRMREIREAEYERRKLSRAAGEQAAKYREEVADRTANYSKGDVVNHLAKVNAKKRREESESSSEDPPPTDS
jgi:hypothetical protein